MTEMAAEQRKEMDLMTSREFESDGKLFTVMMSDFGLEWETKLKKAKSKTEEDLKIPWCDVIIVHQGRQPSKTGGDNPDNSFTLHYIFHQPRKHWRHKQKVFTSKDGNCQEWVNEIQQKCKVGKPQSLLVIINPIGGSGNGRQIYDKKVAPLLALAEMKTDVLVTEKYQHAEEIAKSYDLSKVDGIVVVGGDGLYQEVLNGLLIRTQEEAGIDFSSPTASLKSPSIKVGIIPAGTGNGVSSWACDHIIDVETAALVIVRGITHGFNILSLHEPGRFVVYSGLLIGYGFLSDVIRKTDDRRWMRKFRYPYTILTSIAKKRREFVAEVEFLLQQDESLEEKENQETEGATAGKSVTESWQKIEKATYIDFFTFAADTVASSGDDSRFVPSSSSIKFVLESNCSSLEYMKFWFKWAMMKKDAYNQRFVNLIDNAVGLRVKVLDKKGPEDSNRQVEKEKEKEKFVDVDGEVSKLESNEMEIRLHSKLLQVFSADCNFAAQPSPSI